MYWVTVSGFTLYSTSMFDVCVFVVEVVVVVVCGRGPAGRPPSEHEIPALVSGFLSIYLPVFIPSIPI